MVHDDVITSSLPAGAARRERLARPTKPGKTRFWCSGDPDREHPFYSSGDLVLHVMQARAHKGREAAQL